ncbi:hypothetical protein [Rhizobium pusense]|uniref:hypothetical protein n=1 Tax=Agrobacterium pusense TaxID=648995 RepID=UPI002449F44B|nr:hypothetical protein [Agrobacterium pusense]
MVDANAWVVDEKPDGASVADQVAALRAVFDFLENGTPVPLDAKARVRPGLKEYFSALDHGRPASLDFALGLKSHGGVTAHKAVVKAERDTLLHSLARSHWPGQPVATVSRQMYTEFCRYEKTRWQRERERQQAPSSEPHRTFWQLLQMRSRVPGPDHLRKILAVVFQDPI